MNEIMRIMQTRRSYRSFKPEPIREEELQQIIDAGLWAPSGGNAQSCHFTIVQSSEIVARINQEMFNTYAASDHPFAAQLVKEGSRDFFYGAPTVVALSGDSRALTPQDDMAVASQNMMLAAEALGIGSCWISFAGSLSTPENLTRFRQLLELPEHHVPHHAMIFGYRTGAIREPLKIKEGRVNRVG